MQTFIWLFYNINNKSTSQHTHNSKAHLIEAKERRRRSTPDSQLTTHPIEAKERRRRSTSEL
ncbi:MAG: hypothetical protein RSC87_08605 [Muribaculaceae bacterium]